MGDDSDDPQPGFHHWESFKGQGVYTGVTLNINGEHTSYEDTVYTSDLLTEHAVEWIEQLESDQPFFVYLSHKAAFTIQAGSASCGDVCGSRLRITGDLFADPR